MTGKLRPIEPRRVTAVPSLAAAGGGALCLGLIGCATVPAPPPEPIEPPHVRTSVRGPGPALDLTPARSDFRAWVPALATWRPWEPLQSSVFAIEIGFAGPRPAGAVARASVAGHEVALRPTTRGWQGIAGLPLDSAGTMTLEFEVRQGGLVQRESRPFEVKSRTWASSRLRVAPRGESRPETQRRIAQERERIRAVLDGASGPWLPDAAFVWPRPPDTSSPYGQRRVFNGQTRSRHMGLDLRGDRGDPIHAPAAGRVALVGNDFFYQGNAVYLDHGLGLLSAYFHMSSVEVREGDMVSAGQRLGRVGSTGRSTGPHLHWSVYVGGRNVDPASLIGLALEPESAGQVGR